MNIIEELDMLIDNIKERKNKYIQYLENKGDLDYVKQLQESHAQNVFTLKAKSLKELRMAVIMDQFTLESYRPECQLLEITPDNWREEIETFKPDLLFIESAWKGKDDLWYRKVDRSSKEMYELTDYCHAENIPVIFWNKEDPIYTAQFMTTAALADVVFTTDIDCIQRYKTELGHDQVYHLHFAAQPMIHNPIEKYDRKDKFCFAGAYYHKYKQRAEVFDKFSEIFIKIKGFDIYDRNYQNARPEHAFPERYNPYILGSLPSSQIDVAYKGYVYGINMNSVQQSQTMFARRVFEMLASNTITVGNYSRGVKNYFGDLTICTDDQRTMENYLQEYCGDDVTARKYRLAGLRTVLSNHLYEDRLDYIVQKVFGISFKSTLPTIAMVARCGNAEQVQHAIKTFNYQLYSNKKLYILGQPTQEKADNIKYLSRGDAEQTLAALEGIAFYSCISAQDYYGPNYLLDLALTCRYGTYNGIGKATYYLFEGDEYSLKEPAQMYRQVACLISRRSIISADIAKDSFLWEMGEPNKNWHNDNLFAIDEFNYCADYKGDSCPKVDDIIIHDVGLPLDKIEHIAENIQPQELDTTSLQIISGHELATELNSTEAVCYSEENKKLRIESHLADGVHEYAFTKKSYILNEFTQNGKLQIRFKVEGTLDCICVCAFYDANGQKIAPQYPRANAVFELVIPENAVSMKLGFRPKGSGTATVYDVIFGKDIHSSNGKGCFLSRSDVLVVSNQYPTPDALYRNMFVHKRMTCYKSDNHTFDVMRMNTQVPDSYREFEGINVVDGGQEMLASILDSGQINTVCIHFLDSFMWNVLKDYAHKIRILVWCHGSEIQPWWRREYNYHSEKELNEAKAQSAKRMDFWAGIFKNIDNYPNLHFVFVSQYFADEIFEDNKIQLPKERYSIIHNCIDTSMFEYVPKPAEQRKKVLSIRPYASDKYANDLTVKCIQELAQKTYFEDLEIRLIGNGDLFESTLKPLRKYKNVIMEKRFLRQEEIADLHKNYGIFIVPTRMDAQGVSRDEAMSSGLIPVTNAVTAIPEFVDDECGILAPGEDYIAMAEGIDKLYNNPDLFTKMSANAAARVRRQTSKEYTIDKEITLICGS